MEKTYLTDKEVSKKFGVSRVTIWRWVKSENFPKPLKLSAGVTRWKSEDLESWENNLEAVRG